MPVLITAGSIKQNPATIRPFHPAFSRPIWMAISVLFGPGIKFVAPIRSRKCCWVSHFLFATTSSCIIAMCAAGPPNPIVPSFKNNLATCFRLLWLIRFEILVTKRQTAWDFNYIKLKAGCTMAIVAGVCQQGITTFE